MDIELTAKNIALLYSLKVGDMILVKRSEYKYLLAVVTRVPDLHKKYTEDVIFRYEELVTIDTSDDVKILVNGCVFDIIEKYNVNNFGGFNDTDQIKIFCRMRNLPFKSFKLNRGASMLYGIYALLKINNQYHICYIRDIINDLNCGKFDKEDKPELREYYFVDYPKKIVGILTITDIINFVKVLL